MKTVVEITAPETEKRRKKWKRNENSLRDLWDKIEHTNNYIIEVSKGEKRAWEIIWRELTAEDFPNMRKETVTQDQEEQRIPYRINPKRNILETYYKWQNSEERLLKVTREK